MWLEREISAAIQQRIGKTLGMIQALADRRHFERKEDLIPSRRNESLFSIVYSGHIHSTKCFL